jgi:hypothetical protein
MISLTLLNRRGGGRGFCGRFDGMVCALPLLAVIPPLNDKRASLNNGCVVPPGEDP